MTTPGAKASTPSFFSTARALTTDPCGLIFGRIGISDPAGLSAFRVGGHAGDWVPKWAVSRCLVAAVTLGIACTTSSGQGVVPDGAADGRAGLDAELVADAATDGRLHSPDTGEGDGSDAATDGRLNPPDAAEGDGAVVVVETVVRAAIEAGCTEAHLAAVAGAELEAVREAIRAVDAAEKLRRPSPGLSHGHAIPASYEVEMMADLEVDYDLFVPDTYRPEPDGALPLFVNPAHPGDALHDTMTLPWLSRLAGGRFIFVTVNFMNHVHADLTEAEREAAFADETAAYHDYFGAIDGVIADVSRRYYVDRSRVYIGGVSAVGASAWFHGIFASDQYAAINPYSIIPAPFDDALYGNLRHVGILAVHGTADEITPIERVRPTLERITEWGFDIEFWTYEGEGHGTMFSAVFPEALDWMLARRRPVEPAHVHKAIKDPRAAEAYWLRVTGFSAPLPGSARMYPAPAPAVVDAVWQGDRVEIESLGVSALELRWLEGVVEARPLVVVVNGAELAPIERRPDPTVALSDYCRRADVSRLWAGRVRVDVP